MKKLGVQIYFLREFPLQHSGQFCYHSSWCRDLARKGWGGKDGLCFNDDSLGKFLMSVLVVVYGGEDDLMWRWGRPWGWGVEALQ